MFFSEESRDEEDSEKRETLFWNRNDEKDEQILLKIACAIFLCEDGRNLGAIR